MITCRDRPVEDPVPELVGDLLVGRLDALDRQAQRLLIPGPLRCAALRHPTTVSSDGVVVPPHLCKP